MSNPASLVPFKKGDDPRRNINGANKGSKWLTTQLIEALEQIADGNTESYHKLLVKRVLKKAIVDGDGRMIEHIWNRLEGSPKQSHEVQGNIIVNLISYDGSNDSPQLPTE